MRAGVLIHQHSGVLQLIPFSQVRRIRLFGRQLDAKLMEPENVRREIVVERAATLSRSMAARGKLSVVG
jgi:hypothetical protein